MIGAGCTDRAGKLEAKAVQQSRAGNKVDAGMVTAFPKNPPPPGIAYSKNFARFQQNGRFAIQVKD